MHTFLDYEDEIFNYRERYCEDFQAEDYWYGLNREADAVARWRSYLKQMSEKKAFWPYPPQQMVWLRKFPPKVRGNAKEHLEVYLNTASKTFFGYFCPVLITAFLSRRKIYAAAGGTKLPGLTDADLQGEKLQ
ncbi:hypothetical protein RvY_15798 [Ramazzottius varieornatus]|uniref:Uncharacterized protein n=1 Tax=Ramazzottius varieornatus TaxID=947166 RepID=A0A1D1VW66_RAMVA|nr:hypothetical protein RvY_15798 [Ramazzottius varieornatus]